MITIQLIDTGCERYTIESDCYCLGRMWEHLAEQIRVVKPNGEENNVCTMIVSASGVVIDHLDIKDTPKDITNVFTRYPLVEISFTFTNETGYVKNSEIKSFYFAEGRKPEDFVPVEPEQTGKIDIMLGNGFVRADLEGNIVRFYNANDEKVQDLDLSSIVPDIEVPTKLSELENDTQFIDNTVDDLVNYYKKSETYSQQEINTSISTSVNSAVADLINSAPSTLDTLGEVAKAIQENESVVTALNSAVGTKQNVTDNSLNTTSKTIVGAINEINDRLGSAGTQLQNILGV